jgi:mono/diheme cytochrome c family protein
VLYCFFRTQCVDDVPASTVNLKPEQGDRMSFGNRKQGRNLKVALVGSLAVLAVLMVRAPQAQEAKRAAAPAAGGGDIARGAYIVNSVAMCPTCHTPRTSDGQLNQSEWLQGGPIVYLPANPTPNWPMYEPRIAGLLPTSEANMITLLTTGIWTDGKELRDPMPKFHMNRTDAEAVVAYLKTVRSAR